MTALSLTLPIRVVPGRGLAAVAQDSDAAIASRVLAIVSYPKGYRKDDPGFGARPSAFLQNGADLNTVLAEILVQEPDADPVATSDLVGTLQRIQIDPTGGRA